MLKKHSFLVFLTFFIFLKKINSQLQGNAIPCFLPNGSKIDISKLSKGSISQPCVECTCQNNFVVCAMNDCPELKTCPITIKSFNSSECCPICRSCNYLGTHRKNNEKWQSVQNSCFAMTCKAGIVTTSKMQCVTCSNNDGIRVKGFCCELCSKKLLIDPCLQCDLVLDDWYHCYRLACPVLDCPINLIEKQSDKCCPECQHPSIGQFRMASIEKPRLFGFCTFRMQKYPLNEAFYIDSCTKCQCESGGITCRRFTCPIRICQEGSRLIYRKNVCCPFCQIFQPKETLMIEQKENLQFSNPKNSITCSNKLSNGTIQIKNHNTYWRLSDCLVCRCRYGKTKCERENCHFTEPFSCPIGSIKTKLPGQCCPFCEQFEATCKITKNQQLETFDGLNYNFFGNQSYILVQECGFDDEFVDENQPQFMIIIHNTQDSKQPKISIIFKIDSKNVNLQFIESKNILENDSPIFLPKNSTFYSIFENSLKKLEIKIKIFNFGIIFDDSKFEIILNVNHKGKICGLCGNFNDDPRDDLWPKYSDSTTDNIERFTTSWKWKIFRTNFRCKSSILTTKKSNDLAQCKILTENKLFTICRKYLQIHKYIRRCTKDVCECQQKIDQKPCFCDAIENFVFDCSKKFSWGPLKQMFNSFQHFPVHPKCGTINMP